MLEIPRTKRPTAARKNKKMQTPTFLELFVLACQGDYTQKTVPPEADPPAELEAVGAAGRTALSLYGLAVDIGAKISAAEEATCKAGREARRSSLRHLAAAVKRVVKEGSARESENDRLRENLGVTIRTLQLLLFAEHPSLRNRDPSSVIIADDGDRLGARIVGGVIYAGPEDQSYVTLPERHPATRLGINIVRAIAGENRHSEIDATETFEAFSQANFGLPATALSEDLPTATVDRAWLRRVASIITALETAPIDHELTLRSAENSRVLVSQVRDAGATAIQIFFALAAEASGLENGDNLILRPDWTLARSANPTTRLQVPAALRAFGRAATGALRDGCPAEEKVA
jgi:hypothetical protein